MKGPGYKCFGPFLSLFLNVLEGAFAEVRVALVQQP